MNENILQWIASLKILWVAVFSAFYGFGGVSGKWKRRFIGSAWMMLGVVVFSLWQGSWHWWYLAYFPLLTGALCMGYGGDDVGVKIRKRAVYGVLIGLSATPLLFPSCHFGLYIFHICLCLVASVVLGVFNPTANARSEETIISTLSTVIPLFLI